MWQRGFDSRSSIHYNASLGRIVVDGLTYGRHRSLADIKRAESSGSIRPPQERIVVLRDLSVRSMIADPQGLQLLSKPHHLSPDPLHPLWVLRPVVPLLLQHDGVEVNRC